jgi:hypothetical protein
VTDVLDLVEQYRVALQDAARLEAGARAADENRKIAFAKAVIAAGDVSAAKAEHVARASTAYREACDELHIAEERASLARAEAEYLSKRWETWRTRMSFKKAQMNGQ